jgi:isoquinoline 1-oxidoreductase beta subunit
MDTLNVSRRTLIRASGTVAGGLLLGFHLPARGLAPYAQAAATEVNAWLAIDPAGIVTIRVAKSEMGEGIFTALPMLVAEELDVDFANVRAEYADVNRSLREGNVYGRFSTGGSSSVRTSREALQQAGASARARLVQAAALRFGVDAAACTAAAGVVSHAASGRSATYGELAAEAGRLKLDAEPAIRQPGQFRLLGTPTRRLDVPAKTDGSAIFGIDVRVPGMVYATVRACPVPGGSLASHDFAAVRAMPGVIAAVPVPGGITVVASTFWQARTALDVMPVTWNEGDGAGADSATIRERFAAALERDGVVAHDSGDARAQLAAAARVVEADYEAPYLAHACMEPLNCTAHVQADRIDVWVGTQAPDNALAAAAEAAGVPPGQVHVHNCFLGGGFGRRSNPDEVRQAVVVAKAIGRPVQLIWTREEDIRQGRHRPLSLVRFRAGFDAGGKVVALSSRSATDSIVAGLRPDAAAAGIDRTSLEGLTREADAGFPYAIPNLRAEHHLQRTHIPVWFWRAVGASQNGFFVESFIDELAHAAQQDPLAFRRGLLAGKPAFLGVLDMLAAKSEWGRSMPAGSAQGVAIFESFGTIAGQVAEVSVSRRGELRVERVVCAIDCGNVVNPLTVAEQVESSVVYGLSAALWGRLTIRKGRIVEGNFDDYPVLRLAAMPVVETHFALSGGSKWGGIGEPALPPVAPAVANAVFRITGKRVRSLPFSGSDLSWG